LHGDRGRETIKKGGNHWVKIWLNHLVKSCPCGATLYQKVEIFHFWGLVPNPCTDLRESLHGQADPHAPRHVNWCNESPLWGETADFWPVSKFDTGSFLLCGIRILSVKIP